LVAIGNFQNAPLQPQRWEGGGRNKNLPSTKFFPFFKYTKFSSTAKLEKEIGQDATLNRCSAPSMNKLPLLQSLGLNSSFNRAKQTQEQMTPSKEEGASNGISGYVKYINDIERASPEPESNSEMEETDFSRKDEQEEEE
jgi:hypothetical protein